VAVWLAVGVSNSALQRSAESAFTRERGGDKPEVRSDGNGIGYSERTSLDGQVASGVAPATVVLPGPGTRPKSPLRRRDDARGRRGCRWRVLPDLRIEPSGAKKRRELAELQS